MRPLEWVGTSRKDLKKLPAQVQKEFGFALWEAQLGGKSNDAKPLSGFGGAGVLEVVESHDGDAYRAVYTVRFREAVYVLHVFQKRSTKGIETSKGDIEIVRGRLREVEEKHSRWKKSS